MTEFNNIGDSELRLTEIDPNEEVDLQDEKEAKLDVLDEQLGVEKPFMHEYDRRRYFIESFLAKGYGQSHIESLYQDVYDEDEKTEIAEAYLSANPLPPKTIGVSPKLECPECQADLLPKLMKLAESEEDNLVLECPSCGLRIDIKEEKVLSKVSPKRIKKVSKKTSP
jgi:DNA-directed RNA polymerase subunit RPC12/RpoP